MTSETRYSSKRNGRDVQVVEHVIDRKHGFSIRVTDLTTGRSLESMGFATYGTALLVAQQTADEAQI